jgi:hypothetical protein
VLVLAVVIGKPVMATAAAVTPATSDAASPPILTALARVFIVKDAWWEWQEGLVGQLALQELEAW